MSFYVKVHILKVRNNCKIKIKNFPNTTADRKGKVAGKYTA